AVDGQRVAGLAAGVRVARVDASCDLVVRAGVRHPGADLRRQRAESAEPRDSADARGFSHAGATEARWRRTALGLPAAHRAADRGRDRPDCTAGGLVPLRTAGLAQAPAPLARARLGGAVRDD